LLNRKEDSNMKLSIKGMALACGAIWGVAVFLVGLGNLCCPPYGAAFLELIDSLYPGYHYQEGAGFGSVVIGSLYGLFDGAIGGAVFAWVYNCFSGACAGRGGGSETA
jgi:hypothetical protein